MSEPYNQPTASPTTKVAAGALAGALTVVLLAFVEQGFNINISSEVASAATVIITFVTSYFVKETK